MNIKKYLTIFKVSLRKQLEYRFNFFLGRIRGIIVLLLLYYVWRNLTYRSGSFAGWQEAELMTYIFLVNLLRSIVFGAQSRQIAAEINDGSFSAYLIKPVNYFVYVFFRELAERCLYFASAVGEVFVLFFCLKPKFIWQTSWQQLVLFFLTVFLSVVLYFVLTFIVNLLAFWSREAMGPRFLFEWFLEFSAGAYFPLNILARSLTAILRFLPFAYLIYFPVNVYLGRVGLAASAQIIIAQFFWLIVLGLVARFVWRRGLRHYSGEGI